MAATTTITDLTAIGAAPAGGDYLVVVDVSDSTQSPDGTTKKMTVAEALTTVAITTSATITGASASALAVGRLGATTPAFTVDSSTALQVAGLKVTGAVTGGTVAVVVTDSGSNANLTVNAKGSGTIGIGSVSTGAITLGAAVTVLNTGTITIAANQIPFQALASTVDMRLYADSSNLYGVVGTASNHDVVFLANSAQIGRWSVGGNLTVNGDIIRLAGTTSSFPAIKRSSALLAVRLADDSADAGVTCASITASGAVTVNANTQLGATGGTNTVVIGGSGYGAGVASLRFNGLTSGASVGGGTLTNATSAGDPAFWLPVNIAGNVRYIPCWA